MRWLEPPAIRRGRQSRIVWKKRAFPAAQQKRRPNPTCERNLEKSSREWKAMRKVQVGLSFSRSPRKKGVGHKRIQQPLRPQPISSIATIRHCGNIGFWTLARSAPVEQRAADAEKARMRKAFRHRQRPRKRRKILVAARPDCPRMCQKRALTGKPRANVHACFQRF